MPPDDMHDSTFSNQGQMSPANQHRQGPPSFSGQGQMPPANQHRQGPASLAGVGPVPPGNPHNQGPASFPGVGPVPPANQPDQGPVSLAGVGQVPPQHNQGPASLAGVGQVPPANPHNQGPASFAGVGQVPPANPHHQNSSLSPEPPPANKGSVSRRKLLIGGTIVGSALAATGGIALAVQETTKQPGSAALTQPQGAGQVREYWVQASSFMHNLVPTGYDGMMGMRFQASQSSYWAVGYVAYSPNWEHPLQANDDIGPNTGIPGPVFRGSVGDTIRVHFRNNDTHYRYPHSMHPHGVLYTPANNGAWVAADVQPGAAVAFGQTYTYEWHVRPNSVGTWVYHDHSVSTTVGSNMLMEFGAELGLFGFLVLTDASTKPATKEFFTFLHDLYQSDIPVLSQDYDCFNGSAYLGNTPTFNANVGDTIRWHIGAMGKEFHAFHLHGHRWASNNQFVDVVLVGPSSATSFDFVADNPGKWLYHCHVTDHMMGGMIGMYIVHP